MDIILATRNAPHGKVLMEYQDGPPETLGFATTLHGALNMAGWGIPQPKPIPSVAAKGGGGVSEIIILWPEGIKDIDKSLPAFKVLFDAFVACKYRVGGTHSKEVPPDTLLLLIGPHQ